MDEDRNALAAEYVLGTLDEAERSHAAALAVRDPQFAAAVADWEHRLSPLLGAFAEVKPRAGLLSGIVTAIGSKLPAEGYGANTVILKSRNRWRAVAVASTALAASLLLLLGVREVSWQSQPSSFVAVLQPDALSPAFLLSIDTRAKSLTVRPVKAAAEPDKSYELWLVHDSLSQPRSLGLISDVQPVSNKMPESYDDAMLKSATYAVSLEPKGGSQTGAPTGPVLFTAKLIPSGN